MKARGLYSQAYEQFEVTLPSASIEESRTLKMQAALVQSFKNRAERSKADYEKEKERRMQKDKDLEEAEERIKKLREELAFLEETFEVVAKRPLLRSELDSPELHAEKKVKIEEVPDIKKMESIKSVESIKKNESIKSVRKIVEVKSRGSKPKVDTEDTLELNSDGEIVGGKEEIVERKALRAAKMTAQKKYFSTKPSDKSEIHGYRRSIDEIPLKTLLGENGLNCSDDELVKQSLIAWRHYLRCKNEYKPDKALAAKTHEAHVKILMSALSSFKRER